MRRFALPATVLLAALAAAPAASAAPPRPVPIAPSPGHRFPPPVRAVTFTVEGQADEPPGTLHVEFTDSDGEIDATGRFQNEEGGVDDYVLKQVEPGGTRYRVRVPASAFERYGDQQFFWHAYRTLPAGSCTPVAGAAGPGGRPEAGGARGGALSP